MFMQKKKILYVITKSVWGGAQRYVFDLATELPRDKFEVVAASGGSGPLITKLHSAGIRTIDIPAFQRDIHVIKELQTFWQLFKLFRQEKPDIIHLNSSKAGGLGALAAFFYNFLQTTNYKLQATVLFTVHGWGFNESRTGWQKFLIKLATRISAAFQNKIILINNADYKAARTFIPERKLWLIPNGIRMPDFLPRREALEFFKKNTIRAPASNTVIIGTIAELTKNKGLFYLIDAINQIKQRTTNNKLQTIIIGEGENRKKLQDQIKQCGLENTIFFTGFIPDAARYLKAFNIFVLPSLKEGLPYTLLEAMAAGLPTVAANVGGISDIIQNNENGLLIPAADPPALSLALKTLINDTASRIRLGKHAVQTAKTKFALNVMIEKTISLYSTYEH
ncbi:MAG: putative membrane protein [Parcubacteria group bacterium GW2011_GWA2_45_30]|nr:MAG: putative membrane protein [Parcubacteria group bacterium GW2011_GWA2_45_30]